MTTFWLELEGSMEVQMVQGVRWFLSAAGASAFAVTRVTDKIRAPPGLAALTVRNFDTCKLQRQPNFTNVNYVHTSPHSQKIEDNRDDGEPKGTIPALQWAAPGQHPGSHSYIFSFAQVLVAVARFSAFSSCIGP